MTSDGKNPSGVRRSQVLTTYGPGSLIDTPDRALLVGGLEFWRGGRDGDLLEEPRLIKSIRRLTGESGHLVLRVPPTPRDETDRKGLAAFQFPEWFVAQDDDADELKAGRRSRRLYSRKLLAGLDAKVRKRVVPVRFVVACKNGHIDEVPWVLVAHPDRAEGCGNAKLFLTEQGVSGELAELHVYCANCRQGRPLSELMGEKKTLLGNCRGKMPWLGPKAAEDCVDRDSGDPVPLRLLVRHATNAYFSVTLRVISIPEQPASGDSPLLARLRKLPETSRQVLEGIPTSELLTLMLPSLKPILGDLTAVAAPELFEAIRAAKAPQVLELTAPTQDDDRTPELETFMGLDEAEDLVPDGDSHFLAHAFPHERLPHAEAMLVGLTIPVKPLVERVVLVQRLREVQAMVGFTRLEPPVEPIASGLDLNVRLAPLTMNETWRPAIENKGEGVFLSLRAEAMNKWLARPAVKSYGAAFLETLSGSRYGKALGSKLNLERVMHYELPYTMLHTLSHLLLTAIALECGYGASSIRERIYVSKSTEAPAYGILLYTGTPDSEGTLGGLVEVGKRLTHHLARALEMGALCSNDPICAQGMRLPTEDSFIHGAACHGCVLVSESSCERRNEFLDRNLVMPTLAGSALAFFGGA